MKKEETRPAGVPGIALGLISCLMPIAYYSISVVLFGLFSSPPPLFAMILVAAVATGIGGCLKASWITGLTGVLLNSATLVDAIYHMFHPAHF